MMKKFTALLISLLLLCTLAAAETTDYTGTWYLVSVESGGVAFNPADLGMEMIMVLNEDGTGVLTVTDEEDEPATWTLDGETLTVVADESPMEFTLTDDGQLYAVAGENTMAFGREPAAATFVAAAEIAAEEISAFDGTWTITTVNAYGMVIPFAAMAQMGGMEDGSVVIENGSVTAFGAEAAETGTFEDGKLVIAAPAETDAAFGKTISLLEDGTISITYMEMVFYCEMVEVAE